MRIWVDDVRPMPRGSDWFWVRSTRDLINFFIEDFGCDCVDCKECLMSNHCPCLMADLDFSHVTCIDLDHDAGDYACDGGDYIVFLHWLEAVSHSAKVNLSHITFHIHSMNVVGRQNMMNIIQANGWRYV